MKTIKLYLLFAGAILLGVSSVTAQNYEISWFTIDGGGGTSTGGVYTVSGTIGQPDAGTMAGGPYELAVMGTDTLRFRNVMIGEVWLCSGQSNMEMPMVSNWATVNNFKAEVAAANYPRLRLIIIQRAKSTKPRSDARPRPSPMR
jgi:hypothetical protein